MNTPRNTTLLAGILMMGALLASGAASAAVLCSTLATTDAWATAGSCSDSDGDLLLTFNGYTGNFPHNTGFSPTEAQVGSLEIYDVGFDWSYPAFSNGYGGNGAIRYTITSVLANEPAQLINGANFDTLIVGVTTATKNLYDIGPTPFTPPFVTLTSNSGSHAPLGGGEVFFSGRSLVRVVDTFTDTGGNGVFLHADNSFSANAIPEPESYAMMLAGLGLLGFMARRRKQKEAAA